MIARAKGRFIRVAPRKAQLAADLIRGKHADEALSMLRFTPKSAAATVERVLKSAIANAEQRDDVNVDNLYVSKATVDGGPMLKRFRPAPHGRAVRIRKRSCHITIELDEKER
ncbi:MAG: 50S ribosomal protein L22 [Candidatus Abyssobacteria bacterium SURF_17]|uniref:Large ribosomal subunit protein uL22 n=1 Tax=Candidatus Abyssobacteria bacterium SURF_17 TaxID=2093361 RepID=A0A419EVI7_9BACT|nr:MAG: 50S ribosomal protein L22 [Candidatus Abyssubacteria bacterium SURF_17]